MRLRLALLTTLLLVSCRRDASVTKPDDREVHAAHADPGVVLPHVRVLADIAENHRKLAVVEGTYEVEPIVRGKGGKLVWIVLVDGTRVSRAYAVIPRELPYAGRRVLATGVVTSAPADPYMQALKAPHLALERLDLAMGEPPIDPTIEKVPAPPLATTTPSLAGGIDRWVQLIGKLSMIDADDTATLALADGGVVRIERVRRSEWDRFIGARVTVMGRLAVEKGTSGAFALDLVIRGPTAICPGVADRCGM